MTKKQQFAERERYNHKIRGVTIPKLVREKTRTYLITLVNSGFVSKLIPVRTSSLASKMKNATSLELRDWETFEIIYCKD